MVHNATAGTWAIWSAGNSAHIRSGGSNTSNQDAFFNSPSVSSFKVGASGPNALGGATVTWLLLYN